MCSPPLSLSLSLSSFFAVPLSDMQSQENETDLTETQWRLYEVGRARAGVSAYDDDSDATTDTDSTDTETESEMYFLPSIVTLVVCAHSVSRLFVCASVRT